MIFIVSSRIPPEHSGAGKLALDYYQYLRENNVDVVLISNTKIVNDSNIYTIKKFKANGLIKKIGLIADFLNSVINIYLKFRNFEKGNSNNSVFVVSSNPLTFASTIVFYLFNFKIVYQNTLTGSDDPLYEYPGDFFKLKFKLKKLQYRLASNIICSSPALYELSRDYNSKCSMIPYPLFDEYKNKKSKKVLNEFQVLFVGALIERKGIDIVFNTIPIVHSRYPNTKFTFVGPDNNLPPYLKDKLFTNPSVNIDALLFLGYQEDSVKWFHESDLFFLPSRREGFGMVFVEAMASDLPVVAKKIDDITDFIFGNDYLSIIQSESPEDFASLIINFIENPNLIMDSVILGRKRILQFDKIKIYKKYSEILSLNLNQHSR